MFGICSTQWHFKGTDVVGIHEAKYSCDSELVYAVFHDSSIGVFDATACLQLRCRITRSAYSPSHQPYPWYIYLHHAKCMPKLFPSLLSCSRTYRNVCGFAAYNTMCSGCGSYCFQISSIVAAVWALCESNVVPANRRSLSCFDGKYFDSTFVVDGRITQIAVHPQKRNQFAIHSEPINKVVYVIEPSHELGGEWVCKANQGVGVQTRIN